MIPIMSEAVLTNKTALVTGGNTGIGRAVCLAFARAGADVVIAWHADSAAADSLEGEISALGRHALCIECDVTNEGSVNALWDTAISAFANIDILVNNAGVQQTSPIVDMAVEDFDQMLAVHLRGAFLNSKRAARHMSARGNGRIINVCSQLGYIGRGGYVGYSSAKGGLIAFTRALARELAPQGVLVNGVSPGLVDTGFDPLSEQAKTDHAQSLPLGRLGTPDDMTSAFVFLAGPTGNYYCGQLLHPNGGEIMP